MADHDAKNPQVGLSHQVQTSLDSSESSGEPLISRTEDGMSPLPTTSLSRISTSNETHYKVYKRRFFGLGQLVLLNIVVSWDWIAFASVSDIAADYFNTSEANINWVSTVFLFAFCVASPFSIYALHKSGPKLSIVIAACLLLIGNWIKYGGTKSNKFGVVMFGQLLIGFAQPFVLSAPTSYSNIWFSQSGRITATAVASLANPFGAALGQLISPFWATKAKQIPSMILYISIISSVASLPAFFIPSKPPTPPSAAVAPENETIHSITEQMKRLFTSLEFYLIGIPFGVYVGFFNAFSSLLNQILEPYSFSETDAGIAGAILIVVGLVVAAITSPLVDRYKFYQPYIKIAVPIIALSYLIFIWAPPSRSIVYAYIICAILGAASFGLVPVALEYLVEIHYPLGPELSSNACWWAGQLFGGIFIVIMDALKAGHNARPPQNMHRALIFQAILSMIVMPLPLFLGKFGRQTNVRIRRLEVDRMVGDRNNVIEHDQQGLNIEQ